MVDKKSFDKNWVQLFYQSVTNQFSLSRESLHNTHQWAISLTFGVVATALSVQRSDNPYPNEYGFIILLLTFPLMLRFFIRSCLEYSIQRKWQAIRNNLDKYLLNKTNRNFQILKKSIDLYYFKWKSPVSIWKILWDNLKLAYLWPFVLYIGLIFWGMNKLIMTNLVCISSIVVGIIVIFEIYQFFSYEGLHQ